MDTYNLIHSIIAEFVKFNDSNKCVFNNKLKNPTEDHDGLFSTYNKIDICTGLCYKG